MKNVMTNEPLQEHLERMARDLINDRMNQWAKYYFEKELLPHLKHEIQERLMVQLLTNAKNAGIEMSILFKTEATQANPSGGER